MTIVNASSRYIEWSPVIAGTIVACAVSVVLMQFGHALGLSFTNLRSFTTVTTASILAFGIFALWIQLSASVTGGYLAGRMLGNWDASHESELRDGAHGLLVWALSTLLTTLAIGAVASVAALAPVHAPVVETMSSEHLKKITIISGFSLAAISLVSAVAAWMMAAVGGDHRDRKIEVIHRVSFRRRSV